MSFLPHDPERTRVRLGSVEFAHCIVVNQLESFYGDYYKDPKLTLETQRRRRREVVDQPLEVADPFQHPLDVHLKIN